MKTPLPRDQMYMLAGIGFGLIGALAFAWLGIGSLLEKTDFAQQLTERRGKSEVAELLSRPGGVGGAKKEIAEIEKFKASLLEQDDAFLGPWRQANQEAAGAGQDWTKDPNKWKDMLVRLNDEIAKKAGKADDKKKVVLANNFYLGLGDYKQLSPSEDKVPELAQQLLVSKRLVDLLFAAKEKALEGYPTSCALIKLQGPVGQGDEKQVEPKPKNKGGEASNLRRDKYSLELECSPEVLYGYLGALIKDSWFFVPTNLTIENEKDNFPKRSQLAGVFAPKSDGVSPTEPGRESGGTNAPPLLLVLAGKEKLRVNLQIDFVSFKPVLPDKTNPPSSNP